MSATIKNFALLLIAGLVATLALATPARANTILEHRYSFTNGTQDSVGGPSWNGTLVNGATVSGGQLQLANLNQSGGNVQYMQMPAGILPSTDATIEEWFTSNGSNGWARGFDFGNGPGQNLFFTPVSGPGDSRVILNNGGGETGPTGASTLNDNTQYMVAAVVSDTAHTISYYINGSLFATTSEGTNTLAALNDVANYLGRSQYGDPGLVGSVNEFRIYNGAATSNQIFQDYQAGPTNTPEPSSVLLLAVGAVGLLIARRRRRRA